MPETPRTLEIARTLASSFHDDQSYATEKLGWVYNPLDYAWPACARYIETYGTRVGRRALFLGMNPGPWGMAQTGLPFGDVVAVRDWMGIEEEIGHPTEIAPKRPVKGFDIGRREVSGTRLWGWAEARWETADAFFNECFVWNYCPLMFLERENARNLTPDKLLKVDRDWVLPPCDEALEQLVDELEIEWVIGVGRFAKSRADKVFAGTRVKTGQILHPSPASPAANKNWSGKIEAQLDELGVFGDRFAKNKESDDA